MIIDENRRYHGQALAEGSGPIKVRLVPDPDNEEGLRLGPISLCRQASRWLRAEFPEGGTFMDAWARCPNANWLLYTAAFLAEHAGDKEREGQIDDAINDVEDAEADRARALCPYDEIEGWIRKVMAGRPEVIG